MSERRAGAECAKVVEGLDEPLILALDCSSEFGSIALTRGGALMEEVALHSPQGFAHVLFGGIRSLLDRHSVALSEIDCFGAACGPGSFTGIRVALSAAKGLAEACGKPVAAVSNLQAVAWFGTAPLRAAAIDARRGEIYGAVYDSALKPIVAEAVGPLAAWLLSVPDGAQFLTTDSSLLEHREATVVPRAMSRAVAGIACRAFREGRAQDPAAIDANYVRRPDAELKWREA